MMMKKKRKWKKTKTVSTIKNVRLNYWRSLKMTIGKTASKNLAKKSSSKNWSKIKIKIREKKDKDLL